MGWTVERVAEAKRRWIAGDSAAMIASALGGVTRNAVISKVRSLGLTRSTWSAPAGAKVTTAARAARKAVAAPKSAPSTPPPPHWRTRVRRRRAPGGGTSRPRPRVQVADRRRGCRHHVLRLPPPRQPALLSAPPDALPSAGFDRERARPGRRPLSEVDRPPGEGRRMTDLDPETLEWAREAFFAGDGVAAIADVSGVAEAVWRQILGVHEPRPDDPNRERDLQIVEHWRDGVSAKEIGATFGISENAVRNVAAKMRMQGEEVPRRPVGWRSANTQPRRPRPQPPSPRNIAILKSWAAGKSSGEIARSIPCSRNAVLGVVWRANCARRRAERPSALSASA